MCHFLASQLFTYKLKENISPNFSILNGVSFFREKIQEQIYIAKDMVLLGTNHHQSSYMPPIGGLGPEILKNASRSYNPAI